MIASLVVIDPGHYTFTLTRRFQDAINAAEAEVAAYHAQRTAQGQQAGPAGPAAAAPPAHPPPGGGG